VEPATGGPEYLGAVNIGGEGGGFTVDPRSGAKKPSNFQPKQANK
jgi:hypothetical protein